ncbi:MAG TPA: J domain-containing protein [Thermoanaerobaculia bacterium]|nr:J domain-containing protein [Thermoanaerobaculia bacterium]
MTVSTKEKDLALEERTAYEAAGPELRGKRGMYEFIKKTRPAASAEGAKSRARLLNAGDRADQFWLRVETGMPLSTAVRLLFECEQTHVKSGKVGGFQDVVRARLERYDSEGTLHVTPDGRSYRVSQSKGRAARIAKGQERPRGPRSSSKRNLKGAARDAIAAWLSARLPKGDDRAEQWVADCMREVETVLDSFAQRFTWPTPKRNRLNASCDLLNIPRPRWGQRADQERAWKNRRSALRAHHPDVMGHEGGVEAFQAINDAYQDVVAYNDSLDSGEPAAAPPARAARGTNSTKEQERETDGTEQ